MSSLSGRSIRVDARRNEQRILDCTAELIAIDPSATLEQIAKRAGVSRVTLHARFPSRDALMDALTDRSVTEVTAAVAAAHPEQGPAGEALQRVVIAAWDTIGRYRGLVTVNQRLDPAVLRARLGPATALLLPLIKRGQQAGEFNAELPLQWLLTVMLDLIHAASRQVSTGAVKPDAAQTALQRTVAAALRPLPAGAGLAGQLAGLDNRAKTDDRAPSVFRPGDVTYLHIPCREPQRAADFYETVFAWTPRRDSDEPAFTDATGHVIGHFIAGEPPQEAGIIPYVYVDDVRSTMTLITDSGGTIAGRLRPEGTLQVATFRDPEGNLMGIWTETATDLRQD